MIIPIKICIFPIMLQILKNQIYQSSKKNEEENMIKNIKKITKKKLKNNLKNIEKITKKKLMRTKDNKE